MDPAVFVLDDEAATKPSRRPSLEATRPEQHNIELFWDSMLKLEEKAESDPAFSKQLAQLRQLAQATMISNDEAVSGRSNASLMNHIAVLKSSPSSFHSKPDFESVGFGDWIFILPLCLFIHPHLRINLDQSASRELLILWTAC